MLKNLFLLVVVFCAAKGSYATNVQGLILGNITWTKANSPYIVTGDIDIDTNASLTIEPGVRVQFSGNYTIYVDGKINAVGTDADSIIFTSGRSNPNYQDWNTIWIRRVNQDDTFKFNKCHFSYAARALHIGGMAVQVTNSTFDHNNTGIHNYTASIATSYTYCDHNAFLDNWYSIFNQGTYTIVSNCVIMRNSNSFGANVVTGNYICYNDYGVDASPILYNNTIMYNNYAGVKNAGGSGFAITYNRIDSNKIGIANLYNAVTVEHNSIKGNETGVVVTNTGAASLLRYNCIEQNTKYDCYNQTPDMIYVSNNYWGYTDSTQIMPKIFDYYTDFSKGKVVLSPVLPNADSGCSAATPPPPPVDSNNHTTGVPKTDTSQSISLYPNPFTSSFSLNAHSHNIQTLIVCNTTGQRVLQLHPGKNEVVIDGYSLPAGLYYYKVTLDNNSITTGKLIKQ